MGFQKKIDICLVVDRSSSLKKDTETINAAIVNMVSAIKSAPKLHGCEIFFTLVSFANSMVKHVDFEPIDKVAASALSLTFDGQTNPAPALEYAFNESSKRYYKWKDDGEEAYHPLIFFFTDGNPYPVEKYMKPYEKVAAAIKEKELNKKLLVVCAGYGGVNMDNLRLMTNFPERALKMSDGNVAKLKDFFNEVIVKTCVATATNTVDQLAEMFAGFTEE